eukprot:6174249-Pleurochrysis_carterae.AAC.1
MRAVLYAAGARPGQDPSRVVSDADACGCEHPRAQRAQGGRHHRLRRGGGARRARRRGEAAVRRP